MDGQTHLAAPPSLIQAAGARRITALIRDWPEAAAAVAVVVILPMAMLVDGSALSLQSPPSKWFAALNTSLICALLIALVVGANRNISLAPAGLKPFWRHCERAFGVFAASALALGAAEVLTHAPSAWPLEGGVPRASVALMLAGGAGWIVGFVLLGVAVLSRFRYLLGPVRTRVILLDSSTAGLAIATIAALIFSVPRAGSPTMAAAFLPFGALLGVWCLVVLIATLALVPLARSRGDARTEFCMAAAMLLSLVVVAVPVFQAANPGVLPWYLPTPIAAPIAAALGCVTERRRFISGGSQEQAAASEMITGTGPLLAAVLLPIIVVVAALRGVGGGRLVIAGVGVAIVGFLVLVRIHVTDRENIVLYRGISDLAEVSEALLGRSTLAFEAERSKLAERLHDDVLQELVAAYLNLSVAERTLATTSVEPEQLSVGAAGVRERVDELRGIVEQLNPPVLAQLGLAAAIGSLLERCTARGIDVEYRHQEIETVDPGCEIALFKIAEQAISNVVAHSQATGVKAGLSADGIAIELVITDNGAGFQPTSEIELLADGRTGMALMRRRAQMAGITLTVASEPGRGTEIRAIFPR